MVGYFGLPFVMSLYLQQIRGLSSLATGLAFLPMMLMVLSCCLSAPGWSNGSVRERSLSPD